VSVDALSALARSASSAGIFSDFDGCLSPIVADPDEATPVPGAEETLAALASRFRVVAVISGRSVADLSGRVHAHGVRLIGLHGLEEWIDGEVHVAPEAASARDAVSRAADALEGALPEDAVLERKGLALAVHFRRARDPEATEAVASPLVRSVAAREGLRVVPGRRILEVRPNTGGDKGDAIRRAVEAEGLTAALVGGDDVGDLPAFQAVASLETSVRVAVASAEAPDELIRRADLAVPSPEEYVALLQRLARDS